MCNMYIGDIPTCISFSFLFLTAVVGASCRVVQAKKKLNKRPKGRAIKTYYIFFLRVTLIIYIQYTYTLSDVCVYMYVYGEQ